MTARLLSLIDLHEQNLIHPWSIEIEMQGYLHVYNTRLGIDSNSDIESSDYKTLINDLKEFCKNIKGTVLDIGCGDPKIGAFVFSDECSYIGLNPNSHSIEGRVNGYAEINPFNDNVFDCVLFNGSLDHILDHYTAVEEAYRVLKPGGKMIVTALVWEAQADMLRDTVHFHHFRRRELEALFREYCLSITHFASYPWKFNNHRHVEFFELKK